MDFQWTKKDLLSLYDLSRDEILHILNTAEEFKKVSQRNVKKVPALRGRTVVNLFVEPSTRTRVSFELAEQRLSADIINMNADVSSFRKGETLLDTLKNIQALQADIVVIRHQATGAPNFLARELNMGVVNAGDGAHSHPTQALLDIFTMREKKGRIEGLNVVVVGDILHSRVARSNAWGLIKLGANVTFAGPIKANGQCSGGRNWLTIEKTGVGTVTFAGEVKRAPEIFIKCNLEWLYRFLKQPSRLGRFKALPKFILTVKKEG